MLEQIIGAALTLLFLVDIFVTVLYARAGTGLLAPRWNRAVWAALGAVASLGRRRGKVLSFAGPSIVVSLIGFWALGLTLGAALIIHPELGEAIRPSSGAADKGFSAALLVAGASLSIIGGGSNYEPYTAGARFLFLVNSLIGASVLSLLLSYLVQVYSALRERNALALAIHLMTEATGDAASMLARLAPDGDSSNAASELDNLARSLVATKEAHHFYPLLFYFRFEDPLYAVSRFSFVLLDLASLIETALDQRRFGSLARSAPVSSLRQCAFLLLETLDRVFPTASKPSPDAPSTSLDRSYAAAIDTLTRAGIATRTDGVEDYIAERRKWEPLIQRVAPTLGYAMDEIDRRRPAARPALSPSTGNDNGE